MRRQVARLLALVRARVRRAGEVGRQDLEDGELSCAGGRCARGRRGRRGVLDQPDEARSEHARGGGEEGGSEGLGRGEGGGQGLAEGFGDGRRGGRERAEEEVVVVRHAGVVECAGRCWVARGLQEERLHVPVLAGVAGQDAV